MGLDSVELVLEVEDRFKVRLPDAACGRVRTVADLAALVLMRLPRSEEVCPTARAFYELRRLLVETLGVPRREVRPGMRLEKLVPRRARRKWDAVCRKDRRVPALVATARADGVMLWVTGVFVLVWVVVIGAFCAGVGVTAGLALGLVGLVPTLGGLHWIGSRLRHRFPEGVETVGDVARLMAPLTISQRTAGERLIAQQRVLEEVRRMTAEQMGLPLEKVRAESRFVEDLGMG